MRFVILLLTLLCGVFAVDAGAVSHIGASVFDASAAHGLLFYLTMGALVVGVVAENSPRWLTVDEAAQRLRVGKKTIYRAVASGHLRAARIGGRRELRLLAEWCDEFLLASAEPIEVHRGGALRVAR